VRLPHLTEIHNHFESGSSVQQMLKNWRKQGLVVQTEMGRFRKIQQ
jgi:hypothetical protein